MEEDKYLCFIRFIGTDIDNNNIYEFLFTEDTENFWGDGFEYMPASLCNELTPEEGSFDCIKTIKTKIKLGLAQDCSCFSYQDCIDGIIAICYEDMSEYEEYPQDGRLVFHFGDSLENVEYELAKRNIVMTNKELSENEEEEEIEDEED